MQNDLHMPRNAENYCLHQTLHLVLQKNVTVHVHHRQSLVLLAAFLGIEKDCIRRGENFVCVCGGGGGGGGVEADK